MFFAYSTVSNLKGKQNSQVLFRLFLGTEICLDSSCSIESQSKSGSDSIYFMIKQKLQTVQFIKRRLSQMSQVKPRKQKIEDWIDEESVIYKSGRTYGRCKFCKTTIRASVWQKHPKKCTSLKQKLDQSREKKINEKKSVEVDYLSVSQQVIKAISTILKIMIPKYLQQVYCQGMNFEIMSRMMGRVYSCCKRFVAEICSQSNIDDLTLEQIQSIVPSNYHVNITCVIKNVEELENFPLIHQNILKMNASESTKLKYKKAFNLISRHYNLQWKLSYEQEYDAKSIQTIKKQAEFLNHQIQSKTGKKVKQPIDNIYDSSRSSQFEDQLKIVEEADEEELSQQSHNPHYYLQKVQKIPNTKCSLFSSIIYEMEANLELIKKQSALSFKRRAPYINFEMLQNYLKKCQLCRNWIKEDTFMKCRRCCSCYCIQCFEIDHKICQCSQSDEQKQLPTPCSPLKIISKENLISRSKFNVYQAQNRMKKEEISRFEKTLSILLREQYGLSFTRTSVFYQFEFLRSYNYMYDPSIQVCNAQIQKIYQQYAKGLYLPKIKIAKSHKGYGVYAKQFLEEKSFLFEYAGDILPCKVSKGKGDKAMKYLFGPTSSHQSEITAFRYCGIGPLVNHSSLPNAKTLKILINQTPRIIFYSITDIRQNEEICYDYNGLSKEYPVEAFNQQVSQFALQVQELCEKPAKLSLTPQSKLHNYLRNLEKPYFFSITNNILTYQSLTKKRIEIASITKLITVLTCFSLFETFDVDQQTIIEVPNLKLFENETKAGLRKGEKLSIGKLLQAIFICSAGDAAQTLARFFSKKLGQQGQSSLFFLQKMRQLVMDLGMSSTYVQDSRGAKENFSTVTDMKILISYLYKNISIRKYFQLKTTILQTDLRGKTNRLVLGLTNQLQNIKVYGKTGITRSGDSNFLGYKQYQNQILFLGIFGCKEAERWIILKKAIGLYESN